MQLKSKRKLLNKNNLKGFSLVELILYVALVSAFVTAAISFAWEIVYGREKAYQQQVVDQSARSAVARIAYEIRRAQNVQNIFDFQILLDNQGSTTEIGLSGGKLQITSGGMGPYSLTSNQVIVDETNPIFVNLGSSNNNSKNIGINLKLKQSKSSDSFQFTAESTVYQSVELNSQFNQARRLLVDLTGNSLVSGTSIEGITLQNTGSEDVVIDKIELSWTGTTGSENVTEVQMGGGVVEWTGSQPSGSILELTDHVLTVASGIVDIDYINFDTDMSGGLVDMRIIFSDGSINKSKVTLDSGTTPTLTPNPTSTPLPISTCDDSCIQNGYSGGFCDKNAGACSSQGAANLSEGDQYCTGGPQADTCCCNP